MGREGECVRACSEVGVEGGRGKVQSGGGSHRELEFQKTLMRGIVVQVRIPSIL